MHATIRTIQLSDNAALAAIVKSTLAEFGANKPGSVYFDPTTDNLYELFQKKGSEYFVVEINGKIAGGAGIYPTDRLPADVCELVKMYLLPFARGLGLGRRLIDNCMMAAKEKGYKRIYLESFPELTQALKLYEKYGFSYLKGPMGNSGHWGCERWMIKSL